MSSRAIKKLLQEDNLKLPENQETDSENEQAEIKQASNPFELLGFEDEKLDLDEEDTESHFMNQKQKKQKKKKKKKNELSKNLEEKDHTINDLDEIDSALKEVNEILSKGCSKQSGFTGATEMESKDTNSNIIVDYRLLNPENEMKRMFGAKVVAENSSRTNSKRRNGRILGGILVKPKPTWPPVPSGLSMVMDNGSFCFQHNQEYRTTQNRFYRAVHSMNPDNIRDILSVSPYHIDSLLQVSELFKMQEDMTMAAQLVELSLHAYQNAFHSKFNIAKGECHLDYKRQENRGFFIALFRHIQFLSRKACYRTCLEFSKLILSLNADDPIAMLLQLDFYALMCGESDFLIDFFNQWELIKNLSLLPNFAYSIALAHWISSSRRSQDFQRADSLLQTALLMFPGVLRPLLDKCGVNPDSRVINASFFFASSSLCQSSSLEQLIKLYVNRTFHCWQDPMVLRWLEKNVSLVLDIVNDKQDSRIEEFMEKRKRCFVKAPRNVLRHFFLSEVPDVNISQDVENEQIMSFDPLPPADSIDIYTNTRGDEPGVNHQDSLLAAFFNSMLPNYDLTREGAAGGIAGLMDLLRPLLEGGDNPDPNQQEPHYINPADFEDEEID